MDEYGQSAEAVRELAEALVPLGDQASSAVETAVQASQHAALVEGVILLGFTVVVFALGQFTLFYGTWCARHKEAELTGTYELSAREFYTLVVILSIMLHIIAVCSLGLGLHRVLAPEWYGIKNLLRALPAVAGGWW